MKKKGGKQAGGTSGSSGKLPPWMPESLTKGARPKPTKTSGAAGRKSTPSGLPMPNARDDRPAWRQPSGPPLRQAVTVKPTPCPRRRTRREGAGKHNPRDPHAEREALRYENPIASREAILALLAEADGPLDAEQIAATLATDRTGPRRRAGQAPGCDAARRPVAAEPPRRFRPGAERMDLVPGVVIANENGFGFLRPDAGGGDDLFLPPYEMRKVMHGDRVLASVTGVDRRGRREGTIVEVLERRLTRLIGRYTERPASATWCRTTSASSAT
jgi:ribonuclease R